MKTHSERRYLRDSLRAGIWEALNWRPVADGVTALPTAAPATAVRWSWSAGT
ncbi:MAG: hypothetical protein ACRDTF_21705 [Pseudonocardiaceae bacterium]